MKRITANQFVQSTTIVDNGRPQAATANAFIIWAISSGMNPEDIGLNMTIFNATINLLVTNVNKTIAAANTTFSSDPYLLALVGSVLSTFENPNATRFTDQLVRYQNETTGVVNRTTTAVLQTATQSGNQDRMVETTALAVIAWARTNATKYADNIKRATRWLNGQMKGGRFGGNQATFLSLFALMGAMSEE
jgi:hypothetical protein